MGLAGLGPHSRAPLMTRVVAPNPGRMFPLKSAWDGCQAPERISSMAGLGGCGVTKNQRAEAKLSQTEEKPGVTKDCEGESSVVVVPGELLGSPAVISPARTAGETLSDPGRGLGAVLGPVDLLQVDQAQRLLLEVSEHGGQLSPAGGFRSTNCRESSNCLEEIVVSVGWVGSGKYLLELLLWEKTLEYLDIAGVVITPSRDVLHQVRGEDAGQ